MAYAAGKHNRRWPATVAGQHRPAAAAAGPSSFWPSSLHCPSLLLTTTLLLITVVLLRPSSSRLKDGGCRAHSLPLPQLLSRRNIGDKQPTDRYCCWAIALAQLLPPVDMCWLLLLGPDMAIAWNIGGGGIWLAAGSLYGIKTGLLVTSSNQPQV